MMKWVTSRNWKQIKYIWNVYIQFPKLDECIHKFRLEEECARNVYLVICIYTYDLSLLGLIASQADHISLEMLDWLVCGWPWLLRLTELEY